MTKEISSKIVALTFGILVIVFLTIFYVIAWQEPTQAPPGGNVPAPLNTGPTPQTKIGGLILNWGEAPLGLFLKGGLEISGPSSYLKLPELTTSQRNTFSPSTGMMIYNTDENQFQLYSQGKWKVLQATKLSLGESCTLDGDCDSTHCVDGVCCDTACNDKVCQRCDSYSINGAGHCGYVKESTTDPDNECSTTGCGTGNCKGDSYACGYYASGEHNCPACKTCQGATSTSCITLANNTQDTEGSNLCNATCKKCYGGSCVNQTVEEDHFNQCAGTSCCYSCNGSGACAYIPAGNTCTGVAGESSCTATHYRCNGGGACTAPTEGVWSPCWTLGGSCCSNWCADMGYIECIGQMNYAYSDCSDPGYDSGCTFTGGPHARCYCKKYVY